MAKAHLLLWCLNPNCNHKFHLIEVDEEKVIPTIPVIGRLGKKAMRMLDVFNDSDTMQQAFEAIAKPYKEDTWNQPLMYAKHFPYINKEEIAHAIRPIIDAMQQPDKSGEEQGETPTITQLSASTAGMEVGKPFETATTQIDGGNISAPKPDNRNVVDFVPHPSLDQLKSSQARVAHYQSEVLRLEALTLSFQLKNK